MADTSETSPVTSAPRNALWRAVDGWSILGLAIAALVVLPIATVFWLALFPEENIWPHMLSTTLPRYIRNSLVMMAGVGVLAGCVGVLTAWLVVMYRFPGRGVLQWALLLPLSLPAYIAAFAVVDFLEYAGPVQTWMRGFFGWATPRDYMFPEIRSRSIAIIVLASALYPYVYFLTRSVFRTQSGAAIEVARALGCGPISSFFRVGLPLARPAIAASVAIVMMETLNDFGAMEFFAVQTLTTGIFSVWLDGNNAGGAAQIACVILVFVMILVVLEKYSRRRIKFHETARNMRPPQPIDLPKTAGWFATMFCALPIILGFVLPMGILLDHAMGRWVLWTDSELWLSMMRTVVIAGAAALLTVAAGILLVFSVRLMRNAFMTRLLPVTTIGYAAPGAVLGLGILFPFAAMDHTVADAIQWVTGHDPGLLLVGSMGAVIIAYCVRFFAISVGTIDAAFSKISPSLGMASRSLGKSPRQTLFQLYTPLIRGSVATAGLLIFVDAAKELPATLLLYSQTTLATAVYSKASLEDIEGAAPAALVIVLISLIAVVIVSITNRD
jgi:iron(III) transport system permease protein